MHCGTAIGRRKQCLGVGKRFQPIDVETFETSSIYIYIIICPISYQTLSQYFNIANQ